MARARWVRRIFSLGVNRIAPLTHRLISRVASVVMRIGFPRRVMGTPPAVAIACWHSRIEIVGGVGGMRGRSSSAMMARACRVSSSWLPRGSWIAPQTQCFPWVRSARVMRSRLPMNLQREAAAGDINRPTARADGDFGFHRSSVACPLGVRSTSETGGTRRDSGCRGHADQPARCHGVSVLERLAGLQVERQGLLLLVEYEPWVMRQSTISLVAVSATTTRHDTHAGGAALLKSRSSRYPRW